MAVEGSTSSAASFSSDLKSLFLSLPKKRHLHLYFLFIMQLGSAFMEMVSLGSTVPFLGALTNITELMKNEYIQKLMSISGVTSEKSLTMLIASLFASSIILSNIFRFTTLWLQLRLTSALGTDLGTALFRKTLYRPYLYFVRNNSSKMIGTMTNDLSSTIGVIQGILTIITQGLLTIFVATSLIIFNPQIAISLLCIACIAFSSIMLCVKKKLHRNSKILSDSYQRIIKSLQEGFGAMRYIAMTRTQETFINHYTNADYPFRKGSADNSIIRQAPRYFIETIGVIALAGIAIYYVQNNNNISEVLPLLGMLALGSQRLLPALQQLYESISSLMGLKTSLHRTVEVLISHSAQTYVLPETARINLSTELELKNIYFGYSDTPDGSEQNPWILKNINLTIRSKTTTAFVGHTGSGKSTLGDVILGLLHPQGGSIHIDGNLLNEENLSGWQTSISDVPQNIFLLDSSIAENIAFGIPYNQIDDTRVKKAAQLAKIHDFIETLPNKYFETVGERGVKLSGGQKQRIGIARALYRNPSLIIFDEATSALDNITEKEVMDAINGLKDEQTIILIAHRLSTIQMADNIVVFDKGVIVAQGNYQTLMENSTHFQTLARLAH